MPEPTLSTSSPDVNDVNVNLNVQVLLTFVTSLDATTVSPAIIYLENTDLDEVVNSTLQYTAGETTVILVPDRQLEPNTAYQLRITGLDTATSLGALQAFDDTDLTTTATVPFQTGTEISTDGLDKTAEEEAAEGDLDFPDSVTVTPESNFYVVSTNPENRAWDVPHTLSEIRIEFSENVDAAGVSANSVVVDIFPFLDDPKHFAVEAFRGASANPQILPYFEWEGETEDANGTPLDFDPPTGNLSVEDEVILWTPASELPYNATVEVTLDRILGTTGSDDTLGIDQRFTFYTDPWPEWVTPRRVRRALHPVDLTDFPDDVLGLSVWNASVQVGDLVKWALADFILPPRTIRDLVEAKTIAEVFRMLLAEKQMAAGQYKRLGDMEHEIRYPTSRAADAKPEQLRKAEEDITKLEARIRNYYLGTPRTFVKGLLGAHERPNYRTRLWRLYDKTFTFSALPVVEGIPAGNTASERWPKVPGTLDSWS
jgi:hypothetical protein